jgi:hypothetical protein
MVVMFDPLPNDNPDFFKNVKDLPIKNVIRNGAVENLTKAISLELPRIQYTQF